MLAIQWISSVPTTPDDIQIILLQWNLAICAAAVPAITTLIAVLIILFPSIFISLFLHLNAQSMVRLIVLLVERSILHLVVSLRFAHLRQ